MKFLFRKFTSDTSDEELMIQYGRGSVPAFDELYQRYAKKINYYLYKMLSHDKDKADDMTHEVFYRIIKYKDTYSNKIKFSSWIFKIAYNKCIDFYKSNSMFEIIENDPDEFSPHFVHFDEIIDLNNFSRHLSFELDKLNYEQKTAFLLKYTEDYSISAIAEVLGCPEGTVKSRLYYTLQKLSNKLSIYDPRQKYEEQSFNK
jgi:RNA polymerase sigma-70 factor, ECF subfamily